MLIRHAAVSIALLISMNCMAVERPPRIGETRGEVKRPKSVPKAVKPADANKAEAEPEAETEAQPPQAKQPVRRRAVPLVIDSMPGPVPPAAYGPVLTPQTVTPVPRSASPLPAPSSAPAIINRCDSGGCTDNNGVRYNGGVGTTLLSPQGRVCHNNGITVQC